MWHYIHRDCNPIHGIFSTGRIKELSQYFKQQQQKRTLKHKLLYFLIQYPDFTFPHMAFSTILPAFSNVLPKMLLRTSVHFNLYTAGLVFKYLCIVYEKSTIWKEKDEIMK